MGSRPTEPAPLPDVAQWWPEVERGVERVQQRRRWSKAVALGLVLGAVGMRTAMMALAPAAATVEPSPLAVTSSTAAEVWVASAAPERLTFTDGSLIELQPRTELKLLRNTAHQVAFELRAGRALFEVKPGGPRQWQVETLLATVEVLGTGFEVETAEDHLLVVVRHGLVRVRGAGVPGGETQLSEGQQVRVAARVDPPADAGPPLTPAPAAISGSKPRVAADVLWARAEKARSRGETVEAISLLETLSHDFPRHAQAGLAAFVAGRLLMESKGDPLRAARLFDTALRLGLDAALRLDAHRRAAEAWARTGQTAEAEAAVRRYEAAKDTP
jgi:transmembrane sensor